MGLKRRRLLLGHSLVDAVKAMTMSGTMVRCFNGGLAGNPHPGLRATTAERPDHAPMHLVEQVGIVLLSDQLRLVACHRNEAKNDWKSDVAKSGASRQGLDAYIRESWGSIRR